MKTNQHRAENKSSMHDFPQNYHVSSLTNFFRKSHNKTIELRAHNGFQHSKWKRTTESNKVKWKLATTNHYLKYNE